MYEYKNPFSEFDTNVMSSDQILHFFAEPYDSFTIPEEKIISDKSPIIFVGGRGTGKTMLLRQFSYNVQKIVSAKFNYLEKVNNTKYIGIYFRIDKPLLQSLSKLGELYINNNFEEEIFTHFFELTIYKEYLEVIKIFENDANIYPGNDKYISILNELIGLFPTKLNLKFELLDDLLEFVIDQINYIWDFQSEKSIDIDNSIIFNPECGLILQGKLSDEFCKTKIFEYLGLKDISVLLLIDEFESFSKKQQTVINAAMRFNKEYGARLRIGMRPYGFKTFETVNKEDYIKEGRDYSKIEFNNPLIRKNSKYFKLVKNIAEKRLKDVPMFYNKNIDEILGVEENLEEEAKEIVKGKITHIKVYLKEINRLYYSGSELSLSDLEFIRDDNPLYEMECLRLLLKGESIEYVKKAFNDFKEKNIYSDEYKKFANDYKNKYKLSFVLVLCSIYKQERKLYYGFNDFCYLSSGIIGTFIDLCRRTFDLAYFKDFSSLKSGNISKEIQTEAAYESAYAEKNMICRISDYGKKLDIFIGNLGDAFAYINKDIYLRYPETNMFPADNSCLSDENKNLLDVACRWSLIIKKPNMQNSNADKKNNEMYMLNRVFTPIYKISHRTRGGLNPIKKLTDDYFNDNFIPQNLLSEKEAKTNSKKRKVSDNIQMNLFDYL